MKKRILGIDFGHARIGIAISDPNQIIASPLDVLHVSADLEGIAQAVVKYITAIIKEKGYTIEEIIIGNPLALSGKSSPIAERVQTFADLLQKKLDIPVHLFDERLTSVQAERMLISEANVSRVKRKKVLDAVAATLCLQSFLDKKGHALS
jgi:putative Holliday junction resolvase